MAGSLATRLESLLGSESVSADPDVLDRFAVDGIVPKVWCAPESPELIGEIIRSCTSSGAAIVPWGGGTSMRLGNMPRAVDVVLSLHRLSGVTEHDDANLTATIGAGTPVSAVQNALVARGQFLPLDPPWRIRATVGGVVAAGVNGPRRMAYGAVRDVVIGMRMVLGTGEAVRAGGKVVKNVAGYDLCKLFTGSLGTLGVITELTFKLAPVPEAMEIVVIHGAPRDLTALADEVRRSPLLPVAMVCSSLDLLGGVPAVPWSSVLARAEGFTEAVARHVAEFRALAGRHRCDGVVLDEMQREAAWRRVRDFPVVSDQQAAYRLSVPLSNIGPALHRLTEQHGGDDVSYCADMGTGTLWVTDPRSQPDRFDAMKALATSLGGHAVLAAAPPSAKTGIDVWGGPPPGAFLMREVKRQFDPHGTLNPGRFVLGL